MARVASPVAVNQSLDALLSDCRGALVERRWSDLAAMAREALAIARRTGDQLAEGHALRYRGIAADDDDMDASDSAALDFRRAITLFRACGDDVQRAATEGDLAGHLIARGEAVEAFAVLDSAEATYLRLGLVERAQRCAHQRSWADLATGSYESALRRAREAIPMDRAMMSLANEGWALQSGALAALYLGDLDTALEFANGFLTVARIGGQMHDLLDAHLIYYRTLARRGDGGAIDRLVEWFPAVDELHEPVLSATARVLLADARLGPLPDLRAFIARDTCEPGRALRDPWLVAELRHLDARWTAQPIYRDGARLVVDLARSTSLPDEHLILDYVRIHGAQKRSTRTVEAAQWVGLSRRTFYKVRDAVDERAAGSARRARRRRKS